MRIPSIVIGIICIAISIWMFVSGEPSDNPVIAIVVLVIGVIAIATAKRKK